MAKEIKFNIKLLVNGKEQLVSATTDVKNLQKTLTDAQKSANDFKTKMKAFSDGCKVFKDVSKSINDFKDSMTGLAKAYQDAEEAKKRLEVILKQRTGASDKDIQAVDKVIKAQSELGVVSGTVQRMGAQQLATFVKEKGTLESLIPAMNNLIVQQKGINAKQEDAKNIANLFGKAMTGQTGALKRCGITFSEAQANILKYGTEQERAAMLAQVITDNVGDMNAELAKTDAGKVKQAEMWFGSLKLQIGEIASKWLPEITFAAQAASIVAGCVMAANAFGAVILKAKMAIAAMSTWTITTKLHNAAMLVGRVAIVGYTAVLQVLRAAFTGATIGATTLKVAIKSLLISTGVGIAIWALTEAISALVTASDSASDSTEDLAAAEQEAQQAHKQEASQIAAVNEEMTMSLSKLKMFKGSKAQEKKLVDEMNDKYGDALGYYSTVADWYAALTANSKIYCQQMINEIRIRNLANRAAKLDQDYHDVAYNPDGSLKYYNTNDGEAIWGYAGGNYVSGVDVGRNSKEIIGYTDSSWQKAKKKLANLKNERDSVVGQMDKLLAENARLANQIQYTHGYSAVRPTGGGVTTSKTNKGGGGSHTSGGHTNANTNANTEQEVKTYLETLQAALSDAQKTAGNALTVEARVEAYAQVDKIQKEIDKATKGELTFPATIQPTYIEKGSIEDLRQSRQNAQSAVNQIMSDFNDGFLSEYEMKKKILTINTFLGIQRIKPIEVEWETNADKLQKKLEEAQRQFRNAVTVDAKVEADAKIRDIQQQIDRETKGTLTIPAAVEPTYIKKGSLDDVRQSYQNALSKASQIQSDFDLGIIDESTARRLADELNAEIAKIGDNLKPLEFELDVNRESIEAIKSLGSIDLTSMDSVMQAFQSIKTITDETSKGFAIAGASCAALGGELQKLGSDSAAAKAGLLMASVGQLVLSFAQAMKSCKTWVDWLAFGIAGTAQLVSIVNTISGFATGGIVGGTETYGDKKFVRVNSGEMILTKSQQGRLYEMINGQYNAPKFYERRLPQVEIPNLANKIEPANTQVNVSLNANARKMLDMMTDVKKVAKKSGKSYAV